MPFVNRLNSVTFMLWATENYACVTVMTWATKTCVTPLSFFLKQEKPLYRNKRFGNFEVYVSAVRVFVVFGGLSSLSDKMTLVLFDLSFKHAMRMSMSEEIKAHVDGVGIVGLRLREEDEVDYDVHPPNGIEVHEKKMIKVMHGHVLETQMCSICIFRFK
ncbi:hypothetical protein YC2023_085922 [Brassica napus]